MSIIKVGCKRRGAIIALLALACLPGVQAAPPTHEMQRIEGLLVVVATRKDTRFIRNGSDYSGTDAADFLRAKLKTMGKEVATAEMFIERIATKSSTTGLPYLVRFADGREIHCADFLRAELAHQLAR